MKLSWHHVLVFCVVVVSACVAGFLSGEPPVSRTAQAPQIKQTAPASLLEESEPDFPDLPLAGRPVSPQPDYPTEPPAQVAGLTDSPAATPTLPAAIPGVPVPQEIMALYQAVQANNLPQIQTLLQEDFFIPEPVWISAISQAHAKTVQLLLDKQPDYLPQAVLLTIEHSNQPSVLQTILAKEPNAEIQHHLTTASFMQAAALGKVHWVKFFLENGANVRETDKNGQTPLMLAAQAEPLQTLAQHTAKNPTEELTAQLADRQQQYEEVIQLLLHHGAAINARNHQGFTALMGASFFGQTRNVAALLRNGADVNVKSKDGRTALSVAIEEQHPEVVRLLISSGADTRLKTSFYDEDTHQTVKKYPLDYAREKQYTGLAVLLEGQD